MVNFSNEYFNRPEITARRRELRSQSTPAERVLWRHLRSKRLCGLKMRRQYSVGPYIIDFYSPEFKLAIELDGSGHMEDRQKNHDQSRTEYLTRFDITVLRFTNSEVLTNTDVVLERILKTIRGLRCCRPR